MLNLQREFFPLIEIKDFKKILNNLHKKTRRTEISLSTFKEEVVKFIGYDNFSHFSRAISNSKQDPIYLKNSENIGFNYSNGGYLIYLLQEPIRKLLGIPIDLYSAFLDELLVRFSNKKPFLVTKDYIYSQDKFGSALENLSGDPSSNILICMANNEADALACYLTLSIEEPFQHVNSIYDDSDIDEVRDFNLNHLQPSCAQLLKANNDEDLYQIKWPDVALRTWAKTQKNNELLQLLDIAKLDTRFRCRIFFDEFNSNVELDKKLSIKANRLYTLEVNTMDGLSIGAPYVLAKHLFDENVDSDKFKNPMYIIKYVQNLKQRLIEKYGNGKVSVFIISNGLPELEALDSELVIPLSEVLRGDFSSIEHQEGVLKIFGIKNLLKTL